MRSSINQYGWHISWENHHTSAVSPAHLIVEGFLTPASANALSHAAVIIQVDSSLPSSFSSCAIESSLGKPLSSQLRMGPIGSADPGRIPPRSQNEKSHSEIGDPIWEKSKSSTAVRRKLDLSKSRLGKPIALRGQEMFNIHHGKL
jgi:hypothetical protein